MKTDQQIKIDVIEELGWEPLLDVTGLEVSVHDGAVNIKGSVDSFPKIAVADKAAGRVKGVKQVTTDLEVVLPKQDRLTDDTILENISNALKLHGSVPPGRIRIGVNCGTVSLEGDVDWNCQKVAAYKTVRSLKGVIGIDDQIRVKPEANLALVAENIRKALERRADLEAANIKIETIGNKVILRGTVHSWNERREAARAAWSSPGVSAVEDEIEIAYD